MNTQTAGFAVLLLDAAIALFSFFVVAPCVLNAVSLFGVQKQFARTMIDEGVISEEAVQRLHPKKQIAGVIVSVVLVAVLGRHLLAQRAGGILLRRPAADRGLSEVPQHRSVQQSHRAALPQHL